MNEILKPYDEKMTKSVASLGKELAAIRAGRANPAVLDKVLVAVSYTHLDVYKRQPQRKGREG